MKIGVGRRILMFLHWLLSLLICAAFVAYLIVPEFVTRLYGDVEASVGAVGMKIIGGALLAAYIALAVFQAILIFRRKKRAERGFITVDSGDAGMVRIAVSAIEQLVRQSVNDIDGITDMRIDITNEDDAIGIVMNASILSGSHVPTITMNMQRSIRQFVEMNCGVAVRTVSISINSVSNAQEAPRRHHGFGKAEPARPTAPAAEASATEAPVYEAPAVARSEEAPVYEAPAVDRSEEAPAVEKAAEYDPDKPYVSEFARDLAAMKAEESAAPQDADETV